MRYLTYDRPIMIARTYFPTRFTLQVTLYFTVLPLNGR